MPASQEAGAVLGEEAAALEEKAAGPEADTHPVAAPEEDTLPVAVPGEDTLLAAAHLEEGSRLAAVPLEEDSHLAVLVVGTRFVGLEVGNRPAGLGEDSHPALGEGSRPAGLEQNSRLGTGS